MKTAILNTVKIAQSIVFDYGEDASCVGQEECE